MKVSDQPSRGPAIPAEGGCRCQCGGAAAEGAPPSAETTRLGKLLQAVRAPFARRTSGDRDADGIHSVVDRLMAGHKGRQRGLIELLQDLSGHFGYLPPEALRRMSVSLDVPLSRLYALATFYQDFKLDPQGRHRLVICTGTACHVKGAAAIVDVLSRELKLQPGETTADGRLTLSTVNCIGLCGVGPVAVLDGKYLSQLTAEKALETVRAL